MKNNEKKITAMASLTHDPTRYADGPDPCPSLVLPHSTFGGHVTSSVT